MRMGGAASVPAKPERMVVGGRVFSEDVPGRVVTGPIRNFFAVYLVHIIWYLDWANHREE